MLALSPSGSAQGNNKKLSDGQEIFRYDTFGDEQLWTDVLGLHEEITSVSPKVAQSVGLKVDADALLPPWQHAPYFHDGSAPDLMAVVHHYERHFTMNLKPQQRADLVEFLKSL